MTSFRVVGLDLSLVATGVATLVVGPAGVWHRDLTRVRTKPEPGWDTKTQGIHWADKADRIDRIRMGCTAAAQAADLVAIEGPSYGSKGASMHDLGGLWWAVYGWAARFTPVVVIAPSELKKWATGSGACGKSGVARAIGQMWPDETSNDDNELDALALASMAAHYAKAPLPFPLPKYRVEAVAKLQPPSDGVIPVYGEAA